MQNKIFDKGNSKNYTNATGAKILSGSLVKVGSLVGVAKGDIEIGETGVLDLEGVFTGPKAAEAISDGDVLFFDSGANNLTKTAAAGKPMAGTAFAGALSGDPTVQFKLLGHAVQLNA